MSIMAMIYFIFISVNSMTYWAMTTFQTFLAIISRMGSVFEMEEYVFDRKTDIPSDEVVVKFEDA